MEISKEAMARYLQRRLDNYHQLKSALDRRSAEEFKTIGHQLKGNARTFGYVDLEELGMQMEAAGEAEDWAAATHLLEQLKQWIESHQP